MENEWTEILKQMDYNIQQKQLLIDRFIRESVDDRAEIRRLKDENTALREEITVLEYLRGKTESN